MDKPRDARLILSCEHGGNDVPRRFVNCFHDAGQQLASHRGYDIGSVGLGRTLARQLNSPLHIARVTRLLVDLNRSPGHPQLFSEFSRDLDRATKQEILDRYYRPHRDRLEEAIAEQIAANGLAVHVGVHTFTPELNGQQRRADVGLLYDPAREREVNLVRCWQRELRHRLPDLVIRRNYPYRGNADGLTTALRRRFAPEAYLGIELEVNQNWFERSSATQRHLSSALADSLQVALKEEPHTG